MVNEAQSTAKLERGLGLLDATMIVVGSMIGSGVFITSAESARVGARGVAPVNLKSIRRSAHAPPSRLGPRTRERIVSQELDSPVVVGRLRICDIQGRRPIV